MSPTPMRHRVWQQPSHKRETREHPGSGLGRHELQTADGLGLLVQGGGMRGAFAMGALAETHERGLTRAFDLAIGNSSGAISLAYFLAGQANVVSEEYWTQLKESNIFNPYRFWRIVDIDRMIDEAMFQRLPLDVEALNGNPTKLLIGTTDARYRLPTYFCAQELEDVELRAALKATAALPGLFNKKVRVLGSTYIDGGFVDALPLLRLRILGCQRIVVICTSPLKYEFVNDSAPRRAILKAFSLRQHRYVRQWIGSPNPLHDENIEALLMWAREPERTGVLAIAPEAKLPDFVRDTSELHATFEAGREAAKKAYSGAAWLQGCTPASAVAGSR